MNFFKREIFIFLIPTYLWEFSWVGLKISCYLFAPHFQVREFLPSFFFFEKYFSLITKGLEDDNSFQIRGGGHGQS